MAHDMLTMIL